MSEILERFHRALIEEIQTQRPEYLTGPFTVAEIYQNLVPYGSHRDRIGVEMNGDYEDALLRLLAGEGGYLLLESEPALRDLRAELDTANPNTGLYREYAAVDVRLNQAYVDLAATAVSEPTDLVAELYAKDPIAMADLAPSEDAVEPIGIVPPGVDVFQEASVDGVSASPTACQWCRAELPARENLNFCPFCGTDLKVVPCNDCGEELDPDWRFCISCGCEVSG
ncbi:MAG: zinc ribbon domain-containing protein [Gemmatimonadota bacterium]|nr:zinc ribbon domain-containing protein [Gemmatimonadota bacterium]MDH3422311.1 zinc ribbon domain-containing protein [Gemmatimonadota bacterium]